MKATTEALMKRRACATMEYAFMKAKEVNRYVKLYRQHLTEDGALEKEQLDDKSMIEKGYDFGTLLALREIIMKQIDDECNVSYQLPNVYSKLFMTSEVLLCRDIRSSNICFLSFGFALKSKQVTTSNGESQTNGGGLMQYFFPGWTGWYGGTETPTNSKTTAENSLSHDNSSDVTSILSTEGSIPASQFGE